MNRQGQELSPDPAISSITHCDHDYWFELPQSREPEPNHYVDDLLQTIAISELSRVRTDLLQLAAVPALAPHPVQRYGQLSGHRYLGNLSLAPHGQVEEPTAPFGLTAHRDLRRLDQ